MRGFSWSGFSSNFGNNLGNWFGNNNKPKPKPVEPTNIFNKPDNFDKPATPPENPLPEEGNANGNMFTWNFDGGLFGGLGGGNTPIGGGGGLGGGLNSWLCQRPNVVAWLNLDCDNSYSELPSVVELAAKTDRVSTLVSVLTSEDYAPILEALSGDGPLTVFAPTNKAFEAAGIDVTDVATVSEVLKYHVLSGRKLSSSFSQQGTEFVTLQGETVVCSRSWNKVQVNSAKVVKGNIFASNGVVHIINQVLTPPSFRKTIIDTAVATPTLSTLVSVLTTDAYAPILEALLEEGPFTVFAPTDEAFAEAGIDINDVDRVSQILTYHVVLGAFSAAELNTRITKMQLLTLQGESLNIDSNWLNHKVKVNGNPILTKDVLCKNGVVHVIGGVLIPSAARQSVVATVASDPQLTTLTSVLTSEPYAPILEALSAEGPFTVFAPSDEAFAAANIDVTNVEAVSTILTYHVIAGMYTSRKLMWKNEIETLEGSSVTTHKLAKMFKVDDANVIDRDILASNGVIHIIDKVLDMGACSIRGRIVRHGMLANLWDSMNNNMTKCMCIEGKWNCQLDIEGVINSWSIFWDNNKPPRPIGDKPKPEDSDEDPENPEEPEDPVIELPERPTQSDLQDKRSRGRN